MLVGIIVLLFALILIGVPIAYSFGIASALALVLSQFGDLSVLIGRSFGTLDAFTLMAIPFFIFAGDIMKEGEISKNLIEVVYKIVGKVKASFAQVTVLASALFGAISGSSAATVAAIGGILIPEMIKRGYKREYAVAVASSAGFLGIIIPPSVPLIVYALNANVSVAKLFLAGIGPAILFIIGFLMINRIFYHKNIVEPEAGSENGLMDNPLTDVVKQKGNTFLRALPALIMPLIIIGGIYSGRFTPTESGAIAAIYGILVSMFFYKSINFKKLINISGNSAVTSAIILFIMALAGVFGWLMTINKLPTMFANFITSISDNPIIILLILNVIYLFLGMFLETITAIVITTPIVLPLIMALNIDLVHFGIIQTVNLSIGLITPPMALNLLIASKIGNISVLKSSKAIVPYLIVSIIILMLVTYIPEIALFLPNLLLD